MKKVAVLTAALVLASCANVKMTQGEALGTAAGALAGGLIGYQFGGGIGQWLYTSAGAVIGAAGGYVVGNQMYPSDQAAYDRTARQALAGAEDGQILGWSNGETGNSGIFRPTRSFYLEGDRYCRDYRATFALQNDVLTGTGTACQQADGSWRVMSGDEMG